MPSALFFLSLWADDDRLFNACKFVQIEFRSAPLRLVHLLVVAWRRRISRMPWHRLPHFSDRSLVSHRCGRLNLVRLTVASTATHFIYFSHDKRFNGSRRSDFFTVASFLLRSDYDLSVWSWSKIIFSHQWNESIGMWCCARVENTLQNVFNEQKTKRNETHAFE